MGKETGGKGDIGVGFVVANLMEHGIQVALPISQHLPWDCLAVRGNAIRRISIKYRAPVKGAIHISLVSVWGNSQGVHRVKQDKGGFDTTAIYCPETKKCYYVNNKETGESIALRIRDCGNYRNQYSIKMASEYEDPNRMF